MYIHTAADGADGIHMDSNAGRHALWNSPVVQEGTSEIACSDCATLGIHSDQRSFPRPGLGSGQCDLGAYEFQADVVFGDRFEG